ncbi:MAG: aldehyde ferredoxin oxidoreductase family protein [Chloroflexi bacterium]|nr:aldehyde ferredoxin oxidoreductase family protein [Chloroflexota bacterium]
MARGYMGKLLFVDLTEGRITEEPLDEQMCREYVGGYGIGARILYDRMKPGADPLGPDNILGLMTGPLTGTPALIGSRYTVVAKSPLTGTWGDANCGGDFGPNLKFAGYDGVFVSGISPKPVYLYIENGKAELKDASSLWGKGCLDTEDMLREMHGKNTEAAVIGPAGEKLSLISCVVNNKGRAAGRSGLGAVMGSKRLKAVAVNGTMKIPMVDEARINAIRRDYTADMSADGKTLHNYGTGGFMAGSAMSGDSPIKNWGGAGATDFPSEKAKKISDDMLIAEQEKRYGCWHCTVACGGEMKQKPGRARMSHKPEYETLCMCGALSLNDDLESIIRINDICNDYGLDTISMGSVLGFAVECCENDILTRDDVGGLDLRWGASDALVALAEKVARREGIGNVLADGVSVAAAKIGMGAERYAVHAQGQELPAHDPKFHPGLAVSYRMDATPGRHTQAARNWEIGYKSPVKPTDKYNYDNFGEEHKEPSNMMHAINAAGICEFGYFSYPAQAFPDALQAVTGWNITYEECLKIGERLANLRHLFNLREGLNPLQFYINSRAIGEPPLREGNVRDIKIQEAIAVRSYLKAMDWDPKTAVPSSRKLAELGLEFAAKDVRIPAEPPRAR